MRTRAGFSLLEALIALAIAAMALTAIFEMQRQLANGQRVAERALSQVELRRDALAIVRDLNPDLTPEGEAPLPPDLTVRWTATALTEPKLTAGFPTGDGTYYLTLYSLAVEVADAQGGVLDSFTIDRLGWTAEGVAAVEQ